MKRLKRVVLLAAMIALVFSSGAGCSKQESKEEAEVKADDYLEWTAEDWSEASGEQKKECAVEYTKYTAELAGIEDGEVQAESMGEDETEEVISALSVLFQASGDQPLKEYIGEAVGESADDTVKE